MPRTSRAPSGSASAAESKPCSIGEKPRATHPVIPWEGEDSAGVAEGILLIDAETGGLVDANASFRRLVGLPDGDLEGFQAADLVSDIAGLSARLKQIVATRADTRWSTTLRFLSHPPVRVEIMAHLMTVAGRPILCAVVRDLESRRAQHIEHARTAALERIAQNEPMDLIVQHLQEMVRTQCPGFRCSFLVHDERVGVLPSALEGDGLGEPFTTPIESSTGDLYGYLVGRGPVGLPGADVLAVFGTVAKLAALAFDQRQLTDRLAFQAQHDALTGLPNRRLFEDRMAHALASARRRRAGLALFFVDLDGFKEINDSQGHEQGDRLLQEAARRIRRAVRASDTVARMGGDEFTVILPDVSSPHAAARVAHKLLDALRSPFRLGDREVSISGSVGVALYPHDGADSDVLQRHADTAMYRAKASGGNCFHCFTPEMSQAATERLEVETQLRNVIANGELSLFYQPQVSLDGDLKGVEAYVRWQHPQLGFVLPARFIPVAEECGLIVPIGTWVLRQACRQYSIWKDMGIAPPKVSINISGVQFARTEFVQTVEQILQETGVEPSRIELELTETMLMRNFDTSLQTLAGLRKLGLSIAIDDFGTGYSSLSQLHRMPIDVLKVDQSFVRDLEQPGGTRPLVEAIVALAKSLGLRVVAEGVENEGQLEILRGLGCENAQGHLFGPAMMEEDLLPRLRSSVPGKARA